MTTTTKQLPNRDTSKPAEQQGLFAKFNVIRNDGSDQPGGKHHGCDYFVLDVTHDQYAKDALSAYAAACKSTHPDLSADMLNRYGLPVMPEQAEPVPMIEEKVTGQVYGIIDPDYGRWYTIIRKLAWEEGYAIGMHGSFTRDLDLIAVPWAEQKKFRPDTFIARICQAADLRSLKKSDPGDKPHGRTVYTLVPNAFGDPRFIDLSVMAASADQSDVILLARVAELEARITQVKDQFAKYESSANDNDIDMMFEYDELKKLIEG